MTPADRLARDDVSTDPFDYLQLEPLVSRERTYPDWHDSIHRCLCAYADAVAGRDPVSNQEEPSWTSAPPACTPPPTMRDLSGIQIGPITVVGYLGAKLIQSAKGRVRHY